MPTALKQPAHTLEVKGVCASLETDPQTGIPESVAASRLRSIGPNRLPEPPKPSALGGFLRQFRSPLIHLLLAAAGLAWFMGESRDAAVILIVVGINAVIGAFHEGRAERSMEALRRLSSLRVHVVRGGTPMELEASALVPGDLLVLAQGDAVGADARVTESFGLQASEAPLTGESLPVPKHTLPTQPHTPLAERSNMVYSGTHIAAGHGKAVVVATGADTEVGGIARLAESAADAGTPLELRIARFGRQLLWVSIALFGVVLAAGLMRGMPFAEVVMVAISQMVSMVPEGLPVAMTIALAVGMQRMAAHGAVVRRLSAVETLGSTTVICTDKTGTLTRNEMTVTRLWLLPALFVQVRGVGYSPEGGRIESAPGALNPGSHAALQRLAEAVVLCNDSELLPPAAGSTDWSVLGDPTEAALLTFATKAGVNLRQLRGEWERIAEIPFDAGVRAMATWHRGVAGSTRICVKGAPEVVLGLCGSAAGPDGIHPLTTAQVETILTSAETMGAQALRVLAVAELPGVPHQPGQTLESLRGRCVFLGLVGQMDPPRAEVLDAIVDCQKAGIRAVMVTGDHKATGLAIAQAIGIAGPTGTAVDGRELELLSDQELEDQIDSIAVFARVHPAQKLRIVQTFQRRGHVVAMTGDGVNDAPALATAGVGVAMGRSGTDVAKAAAKVVITDDNFTTIVRAVEQGRLVYRNLQKVLLFLFATSIDEVIVLLGALFLGYPLPLAAVQILWINLVTEGVVTINLILEPAEGDEMQQKPKALDEPLITPAMLRRMAIMVPTSALVTLGYFIWRLGTGASLGLVQTETFTLLTVCQWFNVLNCQSEIRSALSLRLLKNPWLLGGLVLANLLQLAVVYLPQLQHLFRTEAIAWQQTLVLGALGSLVLWMEEVRKWVARRRR